MALSTLLKKKLERRHPRTKMRKILLVAWQGGGRRDANRARNVCLGGVYVDTTNPPDVGEIVELFFDTPQGEVHARATVRSMQAGRGMGVEFTAMDYWGRKRLHSMLKELAVTEEVAEETVSA